MWQSEPRVRNWLGEVAKLAQGLPGKVVEVGSFAMHDHNARPLFPGREYLGIDARPGPGVDLVWSTGNDGWPEGFQEASAAVVLSISALEHDPHVHDTLEFLASAVAPGGVLGLTYPLDPWVAHEVDCAPDGTHYRNPTNAEVLSILALAVEREGLGIDRVDLRVVPRNCAPHWPRALLTIQVSSETR